MENQQINQLDESKIPLREKRILRCAIYTRKSSEEGLEQEFNSLDAQRESCEAFILSQKGQGWTQLLDHYDDGGFSGGNTERPGLKRLLADIDKGRIDVVVVYKIDRLSRSILDFTQMIDGFEKKNVLFSAVTQKVSTTDASGRMNLNILISFSQYEREIAGERIRDKLAAAKRKGKYCGGIPILGYDVNKERTRLVVNPAEAKTVDYIFRRFLQIRSMRRLAQDLNEQGYRTKQWTTKKGGPQGGFLWNTSHMYRLIKNRTYIGQVSHKEKFFPGEHDAIVDVDVWQAAQNALQESNSDKGSSPRIKTSSPLRGVIRCGHCGSSMAVTYTMKQGRRYCYYICVKDTKRAVSDCPIKRIPAADIEKAVILQLGAIFRTPQVISGVLDKTYALEKVEIDRLLLQRNDILATRIPLEQELSKLLSMPGNQAQGIKEIQNKIDAVNSRANVLSKRHKILLGNTVTEASITKAFQTMDTFWDSLYPVEQQRLIELLVEVLEIRETGLNLVLKTAGMEDLVNNLAGISCEMKQRS